MKKIVIIPLMIAISFLILQILIFLGLFSWNFSFNLISKIFLYVAISLFGIQLISYSIFKISKRRFIKKMQFFNYNSQEIAYNYILANNSYVDKHDAFLKQMKYLLWSLIGFLLINFLFAMIVSIIFSII